MVTADEARQLRADRGSVNHETYKSIYTKVCARIKNAASRGDTKTEYRIPGLVLGRPPYDISHAIRYNRDKLVNTGFRVTTTDDTLHVDWGGDSKKPPLKKPPPKKTPPKKPPSPKLSKNNTPTLSSISDKLAAIGKKIGKKW